METTFDNLFVVWCNFGLEPDIVFTTREEADEAANLRRNEHKELGISGSIVSVMSVTAYMNSKKHELTTAIMNAIWE